MSYILDALNKSEQERHEQQHAPSLHAVHQQPHPRPVTGARLLIALLVLALLASLALASWLFLQSRPATQLAIPAAVTTPAPTPAATTSSTAISTTASTTATTATAAISTPAISTPAVSTPAVSTTAPISRSTPAAQATGSIAALYQQRASAEPVTIAPSEPRGQTNAAINPGTETRPTDSTLPEAMVQEARRALNQEPAPPISDLPADVRMRLPTLYYSAHIFSNEEGKGFAIINGQRRYRGDVLGPAFFVVELREDGIVLNFENHRFFLDALTDWPPE